MATQATAQKRTVNATASSNGLSVHDLILVAVLIAAGAV